MSDAGINSRLGRNFTASGAFVNKSNTGNRYAYIDLVGDNTYTDFGLRFLRGNAGLNAPSYIQHRGTGEMRFEQASGGGLLIFTNGVARVRLNDNGTVQLSPAAVGLSGATQPAFCATYAGTTAATLNNNIRFETAVFNYGNHYNTANGVFTAPVAGRYFFRFHLLPNNPTTGATYIYILKNGAVTAGACSIVQHPANTWNTLSCATIFDMAAGDTATVFVAVLPAAIHTDANFDSFSGYLLV
jgi:hypothetical protein